MRCALAERKPIKHFNGTAREQAGDYLRHALPNLEAGRTDLPRYLCALYAMLFAKAEASQDEEACELILECLWISLRKSRKNAALKRLLAEHGIDYSHLQSATFTLATGMPIHIPDAKLSLFTIPKNGGTTLWAWAHWLRGGTAPGDEVYQAKWLYEGPEQPHTLIVRRDPVDRFISGYRNFRDKRDLTLGFGEFVERFQQLYDRDPDIHHHFRPQSSWYPDRPLETFTHVIDFEDFHQARRIIEMASGRNLPDLHRQRARFDDFVVEEHHAERIAMSYQCDYDAGFGQPDAWRRWMECAGE